MTWLLIAMNVAVFFALQPHGFRTPASSQFDAGRETTFLYQHSLVPCELTHWHPLSPTLLQKCGGDRLQPSVDAAFFSHKSVALSVLASMFLHANLLHLFGNMWFLWIFGHNVEDRLGRIAFLALYLLGGIVGSVGQVLSAPNSLVPMLGASGAIAAVMGAYLVFYPRGRIISVVVPFPFPFVVPAAVLLGFWFVLQFFTAPSSGIAWVAHVTGFCFGTLAILAARRIARSAPVGA